MAGAVGGFSPGHQECICSSRAVLGFHESLFADATEESLKETQDALCGERTEAKMRCVRLIASDAWWAR